MDGTSPYLIDITEIDGFDDLHHAEGILKEAQERAAKVYHASETHFLINGSTAGIISAILGTTEKGDSILVARNCHKSVYHAIYLNELDPVYIYPKFDTEQGLSTEIDAEDVQKALEEHPKIRAVMIVSPTYDGVVSDIEKIAEIVHEAGCLLIVDEAHGAHFGFDPYFPESANMYGADLVINSLHKTLPALTQTALLHVNGERVNRRKVKAVSGYAADEQSVVYTDGKYRCVYSSAGRDTTAEVQYFQRICGTYRYPAGRIEETEVSEDYPDGEYRQI